MFVFAPIIVAVYFLDGFVLKLLWGWFIVTTFGLPAISLAQAIGISMIVNYLTIQHIPRTDQERAEMYSYSLTSPVIVVFAGWIVHLFL